MPEKSSLCKAYIVALPLQPEADYARFRSNTRNVALARDISSCRVPRMEPHVTLKIPFSIGGSKCENARKLARVVEEIVSQNACFTSLDVPFGSPEYFSESEVLYLPLESEQVAEMRLAFAEGLKACGIPLTKEDAECKLHFTLFKDVRKETLGKLIGIVEAQAALPRIAHFGRVRLYEKVGKQRTRPIAEFPLALPADAAA